MKWSWRVGSFAGIGVFVHATFFLLIGWIGLSYWLQGGDLADVVAGVGFIVALFACVVLHEYGHALTARRYGIQTRDITLLPIGGVARLERMPDKPIEELWVALAGPAVNVVIAAGLLVWLLVSSGLEPIAQLTLTGGPFLERLMVVNIFLVGFNLIPAFPMDGGRVLRALLAMRWEYTRATQVAANIGQALAFVFGFIGLFYNPFLLFIAFFVWIGAAQESRMVQMKAAVEGIPISRVMLTNFETLRPDDRLGDAVQLILRGSQKDFPVVKDGHTVGVLTQAELFQVLSQQGEEVLVSTVMRKDFETADSHEMLETAFLRLQSCECHTMPVTHNGVLVGLMTMDNIGEFLSIQSALGTEVARA
jgi:Zn-dependent protease/predicted transcriptional regulator